MAKAVHLHGIRNCDTMKKARAWLDAHEIAYTFHDYKVEGVSRADLETWCKALGWEPVLNRAGTTFKALPEASKSGLTQERAIELMLAQPSMIKRPMLVVGARVMAGFKPAAYETFFL
jgi:Spx/MgsR family transcriptional regulator